jgi:hypothetical protein
MSDEVIVCADCKTEFTFTASESAFFAVKGLTKPRRCRPCRQQRRAAKDVESNVLGTAPSVPVVSINRTQWIGGNDAGEPRRNKAVPRRRDRGSGY